MFDPDLLFILYDFVEYYQTYIDSVGLTQLLRTLEKTRHQWRKLLVEETRKCSTFWQSSPRPLTESNLSSSRISWTNTRQKARLWPSSTTYSALCPSTWSDKFFVVTLFLQHLLEFFCIQVNSTYVRGSGTLLQYAVANGKFDFVKALLKFGYLFYPDIYI